jgi:hypothetical protein
VRLKIKTLFFQGKRKKCALSSIQTILPVAELHSTHVQLQFSQTRTGLADYTADREFLPAEASAQAGHPALKALIKYSIT